MVLPFQMNGSMSETNAMDVDEPLVIVDVCVKIYSRKMLSTKNSYLH